MTLINFEAIEYSCVSAVSPVFKMYKQAELFISVFAGEKIRMLLIWTVKQKRFTYSWSANYCCNNVPNLKISKVYDGSHKSKLKPKLFIENLLHSNTSNWQ
jgi:hypothetical protein